MMKFIIALVIALAGASAVSAAPCVPGKECYGGPSRGFNVTTQRFEMIPQCFPFIWVSNYFVMDITDMYVNQANCRADRLRDFGI